METTLKLLQADQRNRPTISKDNELLLMYSPLDIEITDVWDFDISITPPASKPQWLQVSPITIQRGSPAQTIRLQYTDSDLNAASNTVSKRSGPTWAVLNPTARTLTITPPAAGTTSQPAATHNVVIRVADPSPNQNQFADLTITINLAAYTYTPPPPDPEPEPEPVDPPDPVDNQPPTLAQVSNLSMDAGGSVGRIIHVADPDTPLSQLTLTKTGVGSLTRLNNPRFYEFRYSESTPTASRSQQVHTVNLSLTDGVNTITASFTVTVRAFTYVPPPTPTAVPRWTQVSPINIVRGGDSQTIQLAYTDSDANQASNIVTKRSGPDWAVLNPTARTLTITPPAAGTRSESSQTFNVVVRVTDPSPNQANLHDMTIVINLAAYTYTPPPPPVVVNDPPVIGTVSNLTIDAGGTATQRIDVSDPDTAVASLTLAKTGVGSLTRRTDKRYYDFAYADTLPDADRSQQTHTINLSLTDGENTVTSSFTVTVRAYQAPPPPATNVPPRLNSISAVTLDRGQQLDVPITYIDPDSDPSEITISRTGDGSIHTTGSGATKKWFWRVSSVLDTDTEYDSETKTATISITDGEDSGNTITATANIRAYTPPTYYPNITITSVRLFSGAARTIWDVIAATHDGTRLRPSQLRATATKNSTPISQNQITAGISTIRVDSDVIPITSFFVSDDIIILTLSYTDTRYTTRNTTTISRTYTVP